MNGVRDYDLHPPGDLRLFTVAEPGVLRFEDDALVADNRVTCSVPPVSDDNVWTDEWESDDDWSGGGAEAKRLPRGDQIGATVYQLGPGDFVVYHFHHAWEELLIVLRGRPTLRTPAGERQLDEGEAVHFPTGPDGAHGLRNETDAPVRYVVVSSLSTPEVAEYPDLKKITAQARTGSQTGERLWLIHDVQPESE